LTAASTASGGGNAARAPSAVADSADPIAALADIRQPFGLTSGSLDSPSLMDFDVRIHRLNDISGKVFQRRRPVPDVTAATRSGSKIKASSRLD
jgi:hypothetical protein